MSYFKPFAPCLPSEIALTHDNAGVAKLGYRLVIRSRRNLGGEILAAIARASAQCRLEPVLREGDRR